MCNNLYIYCELPLKLCVITITTNQHQNSSWSLSSVLMSTAGWAWKEGWMMHSKLKYLQWRVAQMGFAAACTVVTDSAVNHDLADQDKKKKKKRGVFDHVIRSAHVVQIRCSSYFHRSFSRGPHSAQLIHRHIDRLVQIQKEGSL